MVVDGELVVKISEFAICVCGFEDTSARLTSGAKIVILAVWSRV